MRFLYLFPQHVSIRRCASIERSLFTAAAVAACAGAGAGAVTMQ